MAHGCAVSVASSGGDRENTHTPWAGSTPAATGVGAPLGGGGVGLMNRLVFTGRGGGPSIGCGTGTISGFCGVCEPDQAGAGARCCRSWMTAGCSPGSRAQCAVRRCPRLQPARWGIPTTDTASNSYAAKSRARRSQTKEHQPRRQRSPQVGDAVAGRSRRNPQPASRGNP